MAYYDGRGPTSYIVNPTYCFGVRFNKWTSYLRGNVLAKAKSVDLFLVDYFHHRCLETSTKITTRCTDYVEFWGLWLALRYKTQPVIMQLRGPVEKSEPQAFWNRVDSPHLWLSCYESPKIFQSPPWNLLKKGNIEYCKESLVINNNSLGKDIFHRVFIADLGTY